MTTVSTSTNYVYIEDITGNVGQIDLQTGTVTKLGNFGVGLSDIAISKTGQLYGTDFSNLYLLNPSNDTATHILTLLGNVAGTVNALEFAADGTLHIAGQAGANESLNSTFTTVLSTSISAPSDGDLLIDAQGTVYEASGGNIVKLNSDGSYTTVYTTGLPNLYGLAYDSHGDILAFSNQTMYLIDPKTGEFSAILNWAGSGIGDAGGATSINDVQGAAAVAVPTTLTAASAATAFQSGQIAAGTLIRDSARDIQSAIDALAPLAAAKDLAAITLTDSGIPVLTISATQASSDAGVLSKIVGTFSLTETVDAANLTISGPANALGTTIAFSGAAAQFTLTPAGDGLNFTVTGSGTTDHLTNIQALKFSDYTLIVAQAPGDGVVTTGNITNIYAAVLSREPDLAGLSYYQKLLQSNPNTPMTVFALDFLNSSEYTADAAHSYALTTAGDAQFITDTYTNLLHRAPAPGDVAWYQANVIAPLLNGAVSGSSAYAAAVLNAHAALLVDFSNSSEFRTDVEVTATSPASAQHWLVLI